MKEREITALEEGLGYHFRRRAVIEQAVTHSSQAREMEAQQAGDSKYRVRDNEQLEFLGDAVLALVTSEEFDVAAGKISTRSPIGRALLNKKVGDTAVVVTPNGKREMEIPSLTTIHDEA